MISFHLNFPLLSTLKPSFPFCFMLKIHPLKRDSLCEVFLERFGIIATVFNTHELAFAVGKEQNKILFVLPLHSHSLRF